MSRDAILSNTKQQNIAALLTTQKINHMRSNGSLILEKYSFGMGDRFAHQASAQLRACTQIIAEGVDVTPVWNKSHREHAIVGSCPGSVRKAAEEAIQKLNWNAAFHIDADHIRPETLDVADAIGQPAGDDDIAAFIDRHPELIGTTSIPGIDEPFVASPSDIESI